MSLSSKVTADIAVPGADPSGAELGATVAQWNRLADGKAARLTVVPMQVGTDIGAGGALVGPDLEVPRAVGTPVPNLYAAVTELPKTSTHKCRSQRCSPVSRIRAPCRETSASVTAKSVLKRDRNLTGGIR
jgi:hypothetical protein